MAKNRYYTFLIVSFRQLDYLTLQIIEYVNKLWYILVLLIQLYIFAIGIDH